MKDKQLVFIVGSGRSGTTLLRNILSKHPKVGVSPELKFFDVILASRMKLFFLTKEERSIVLARRICQKSFRSEDPLWKIFSLDENNLKDKVTSASDYGEMFVALLKNFSTNVLAPIWIEKTPSNVFFLDKIIKYFPNAKVINMIRDGREVVASAKKRSWSDNTDELAIWWKESVRAFERWKKKATAKYLEIKYESLVEDQKNSLETVFDFLQLPRPNHEFMKSLENLDSFSSFYDRSKKGIYQSMHFREYFSLKEQESLELFIKPELIALGYKPYFESKTLLRFSFIRVFRSLKIKINLLSRKKGFFWFWLKMGDFFRRNKK